MTKHLLDRLLVREQNPLIKMNMVKYLYVAVFVGHHAAAEVLYTAT